MPPTHLDRLDLVRSGQRARQVVLGDEPHRTSGSTSSARADGSRIRQKRVSAVDGEEVAYEEIVKGYEVGPDQYVVVEPDELAALDPKATQTIDIEEFVYLDQIDPIYYEHPTTSSPTSGRRRPTPCSPRPWPIPTRSPSPGS